MDSESTLKNQDATRRASRLASHFSRRKAIIMSAVFAFIALFLFWEGSAFPRYWKTLQIDRQCGVEYANRMREPVERHALLVRDLRDLRERQVALLQKNGSTGQATAALAGFDEFSSRFEFSIEGIKNLQGDVATAVAELKRKAEINEDRANARAALLKAGRKREADLVRIEQIDYQQELRPVLASLPLYQKNSTELKKALEELLGTLPALPSPELQPELLQFRDQCREFAERLPQVEQSLKSWNPEKPLEWYRAVCAFFGWEWSPRGLREFLIVAVCLGLSLVLASILLRKKRVN
jgi:hypothetical protein